MSKPRFVLRTVKNGAVIIFGDTYKPDKDASSLNGIRVAFGLYYTGSKREDFVILWGTEEVYRDQERLAQGNWPGPLSGLEWWNKVPKAVQ